MKNKINSKNEIEISMHSNFIRNRTFISATTQKIDQAILGIFKECFKISEDDIKKRKCNVSHIDARTNSLRTYSNNTDIKSEEFTQVDIIKSIVSGNDTFAIMPTGKGKSYCFQVSALCLKGLTIVITPLVALISDQVKNFNEKMSKNHKDYKAIYPGMHNLSNADLFEELKKKNDAGEYEYKLLYLSPERLNIPKFIRLLEEHEKRGSILIDHIVIDEAHCLSQWGFDFRESYLTIINFINRRPYRPVISAFTATATPQDIYYIESLLGFGKRAQHKSYNLFRCIEKRNNLKIVFAECNDQDETSNLPTRFLMLIAILKYNPNKSVIVYCTTVSQVNTVFNMLSKNEIIKSERLCKYYADMNASAKATQLRNFSNPKYKNVMIATKAFGMGIDKDDVSIIVHYDIPHSLEEYYQEIGRAGRNGEDAYCYLLYSNGEFIEDSNGKKLWPPKGTMLYTKLICTDESKNFLNLEGKAIESRLSNQEKSTLIYLDYYRMSSVIKYCNWLRFYKPSSDQIQNFITDYLSKEIYDDALSKKNINKFFTKSKRFKELSKFIDENDPDKTNLIKAMTKDLIHRISDVNELHVNNTKIANILRWDPDSYSLNQKNTIKILEYKRLYRVRTQKISSQANGTKVNDNSTEYITSILPPDIPYDSAFIRTKKSAKPSKLDIDNINQLWKSKSVNRDKKNAQYLFLVNSSNERIDNVLKLSDFTSDSKWIPCNENDPIKEKLVDIPSDIKGLFNKERYTEWRKTTLESCLKKIRSNPDEYISSPFAYIRGQRERDVSFTLFANQKPTYFDMCVADAIYTIAITGAQIIYIKKIWEILSGDETIKFSRADSKIKTLIEGSINKLIDTKITIWDDHCSGIVKEQFLPLKKRADNKLGYDCLGIPPLYRYAEEINGEIIRIPVSFLAIHLYKENNYKPAPILKYDPTIKGHPESHTSLYQWKATIPNAVLCHYLLHRASIYRKTKKMRYISFDTIKTIFSNDIREKTNSDKGFLYRKIISILLYYQRIGFIQFYGYTSKNQKKKDEQSNVMLNTIDLYDPQNYDPEKSKHDHEFVISFKEEDSIVYTDITSLPSIADLDGVMMDDYRKVVDSNDKNMQAVH